MTHAVQAKRCVLRAGMALTSAAFVSGAIALPASAATAPVTRPSVLDVLSDTASGGEDFDFGGMGDPGIIRGEGGAGGEGGDGIIWGKGGAGGSPGDGYDPKNPWRNPRGGAYGPNTCLQGYVWRDSYDGDTFCVTPGERDAAQNQ
ncbi:hypothetical protein ACFTWH_16050 [Streptomyces sp. NPDC057011]|uniref:hypothetical protein n=1 Tax=unclassified Streptomyces TaxID=2593676 RepID=UPI003637A230